MKLLLTIPGLLIIVHSFAQSDICGFNDDCNKMGITESDFLAINQKLSALSEAEFINRDEVIIPLVFHVFNNPAEFKKIGESEIYYQLDKLNEAFAGLNYDQVKIPEEFKPHFGKTRIRFCIGAMEINGKIEKGIIFRTTDIANFGDQRQPSDNRRRKIKYSSFGGSDQWDSDEFINIWVGKMSVNSGVSTFPNIMQELKNEEGIVIDPEVLRINKKGKILIHEMGHYFSLLHIWGNNENECEEDDGVQDTPQQLGPYYSCPSGQQYSCGSSDMYVNYMDYTDENCSLMFSNDQAERIENCLQVFRPGLMKNVLCHSVLPGNDILKDFAVFQSNDHIVVYNQNLIHPEISLSLYNIKGKKIFSSVIKSGETSYFIDKANYPSGIYFLFLETDNEFDFRKLAIFDF